MALEFHFSQGSDGFLSASFTRGNWLKRHIVSLVVSGGEGADPLNQLG